MACRISRTSSDNLAIDPPKLMSMRVIVCIACIASGGCCGAAWFHGGEGGTAFAARGPGGGPAGGGPGGGGFGTTASDGGGGPTRAIGGPAALHAASWAARRSYTARPLEKR